MSLVEFVDYGEIKSVKEIPVPKDDKIHLGFKQFKRIVQVIFKVNKENKLIGNTPEVNCQQGIFSFSIDKETAYSEMKNHFLRVARKLESEK